MTKREQKSELLKLELKAFLIKVEELLESNVEIVNTHYDKENDKVLSACSKTMSYTLSVSGHKELIDKQWDEIDYTRFRNSFKYKDGFTV